MALKSCVGLELVRVPSVGRRQQGGCARLALGENGVKHPDMTCFSCVTEGSQ